jgi:hypothetical protein
MEFSLVYHIVISPHYGDATDDGNPAGKPHRKKLKPT